MSEVHNLFLKSLVRQNWIGYDLTWLIQISIKHLETNSVNKSRTNTYPPQSHNHFVFWASNSPSNFYVDAINKRTSNLLAILQTELCSLFSFKSKTIPVKPDSLITPKMWETGHNSSRWSSKTNSPGTSCTDTCNTRFCLDGVVARKVFRGKLLSCRCLKIYK